MIRAHEVASEEPSDQTTPIPPVDDLDRLVDWALGHHPAVRSRLAAVERQQARTRQAGSLPEPRLSVAPLGEMAQTAAGEVGLMTGISQMIPAPGSLSARTAVADAETRVAIAAVRSEELALAQRIRQSWHRWHGASQAKITIKQQVAVIERLLQTMDARLAANQIRQGELVRLRVELAELRTRVRQAEERVDVAAADLRAALSITDEIDLPIAVSSAANQTNPDLAYFLAAAARHRPDYERNDADQARAAGMALAARARRRPDVTLSFNYNFVEDDGLSMAANGDDQWWLGVGFSLPVWTGTYAAADAEAHAAMRQAQWDRRALNDQVHRDVHGAWLELTSAQDQLAVFVDDILPDARHALELERSAYGAGDGTYLDLIGAWRRLLALELQEVLLRQNVGTSQAKLLAASGLIRVVENSDDAKNGETP